MSHKNQGLAQKIASKMHEAERLTREPHRCHNTLYKPLEDAAKVHGPSLGVGVAPLSVGGEKPR